MLQAFANWLRDLLSGIWQWVVDLVQALVDWLEAAVLWVLGWLLEVVAAILAAIPVPSWVSGAGGSLSGISGQVGYWVEPFNIGMGIAIILGAYGVRFGIRRIPFIG